MLFEIRPRLAKNIIFTCGIIAHRKLSVFATSVMSFYIRNQDRFMTDIRF